MISTAYRIVMLGEIKVNKMGGFVAHSLGTEIKTAFRN